MSTRHDCKGEALSRGDYEKPSRVCLILMEAYPVRVAQLRPMKPGIHPHKLRRLALPTRYGAVVGMLFAERMALIAAVLR
jgi:hypothetical protein